MSDDERVVVRNAADEDENSLCPHCRLSPHVQRVSRELGVTPEVMVAAIARCLAEYVASADDAEERAHLLEIARETLRADYDYAVRAFHGAEERRH